LCVLAALAACGGTRGDDDVDGNVTAIRFTQSIGGAMWANPDAYPTIPVHAIVEGAPAAVEIRVDGVIFDAVDDGGGRWTARVDIATLADGEHEIVAAAHGVETTATLGIGRQGIQWTFIATDQNAATPRLHKIGDRLFLTWTDISIGSRVAWLQELDGIGRRIGDKIALVGGAGQQDKLYARTAFGANSVGVLYQERGGPYRNFFTVVTADGRELVAPITLDPADRFGSNSGDVTFTGTGYDVVWRTNSGAGSSDIRWLHVDEASGSVVGPMIVALPGAGDPHAGFDAITNVTIRHHAGASLIAFSRYLFDSQLELELLKCQLATVVDGVATTEVVGAGPGWSWDTDCRILDDGTGPVAVRSAKSLTSAEDNPPDEMYAVRVPLAADRGDGRMIVSAPETRVEPTMIATTVRPIMAWSDARSYAVDLTTGEVELYAAVLGDDLVSGDHVRFAHSHFIEGTADIRGVAAGENAIVTWIDERHGGNVIEPRPEVYLETIWQ
jgi:hypothetical protein